MRMCPAKMVLSVAALLLILATGAWAADPKPEEIAQWVKELGDGKFAVREKASENLWKAGRAAEPALKAALASEDAEVVLRARAILDKFKWGIYPDTPPRILELIGAYRAGDQEAKTKAVGDLLKLGRAGCTVITKMVGAEINADERRTLLQIVAQEAPRAAGSFLPLGDHATLEELLETCLDSQIELAQNNYTWYLMFRGRLDAKIPQWKEKADKGDAKAAETLTYLYRAKGDLANALIYAEKSGQPNLAELMLAERGDWKAVAALKEIKAVDTRELKTMGLRAAYHRLAGNTEEVDKQVAAIRDFAAKQPDNMVNIRMAAEVLLLNDRVQEALDLLKAKGQNFVLTFELLAGQMQFKEALEMADKASGPERVGLKARQARVLYLLGERDKAKKIFEALVTEVKTIEPSSLSDRTGYADLVRTELQLGLKDDAFTHFALMLDRIGTNNYFPRLYETLFPKNHATAIAWWPVLAKQSKEPPERMKQLRALLDGKLPAKEFDALIELADRSLGELDAVNKEARLLAIADVCHAAGQWDQAKAFIDKAIEGNDSAAVRIKLGDFFADRKKWKEADEQYKLATDKDPGSALALYLRSWVLTQLGDEKEAKKIGELASLVLLGHELSRFNLTEELMKRGLTDALQKERELMARLGWRRTYYVGNTLVRTSPDIELTKQYKTAALYTQEQGLLILRMNIYFTEPVGYISVPHRVHRQKARAFLADGKIEEALEEARLAETLLAGNLSLTFNLVPELEKRERKKEADELYGRTKEKYEQILKDYPDGAWAYNALAWLDARCRRDLDKALERAKKATDLEPDRPTYMDTLSEVHFQRGDRQKAIDLMKKVIELEPANDLYRKKLKRFETGDPKDEPPGVT